METPAKPSSRGLSLKIKVVALLSGFVILALLLFFGYPRGASLLLSYRKECKVVRIETFAKTMGIVINQNMNQAQTNKFSIICDDGAICRADDTGFAVVKPGDRIEFRGFPEFATMEELGKCDHAQLIRIFPQGLTAPSPSPSR